MNFSNIDGASMGGDKFIKRVGALLGACALSLSLWGSAHAQASTQEAEAQVKAAIAYIKAQGPEKAYAEITFGNKFKDRDLYITVYDFSGKNLAHGRNPEMVGKELIGMKDFYGIPIIQNSKNIAMKKGKGWSDMYYIQHPITKKLQAKKAYVERLGNTFISSGVYIPE